MNTLKRWAACAAIAGALGFGASPAFAGPDQQADIDHAIGTLQDLRHDKEFGNARQLIASARAVMIAPRIFKAGFFFGGQGGDALLMVRGRHGWSDPAFYTIASASFGLQIGATESEMVLIIRSERALNAIMRDRFKIGADAGITVATLGSEVEGATTANGGPDIVVWASSSGAYAGISLQGSLIEPQHRADESYYGRPLTTSEIVTGMVRAPGAGALRRTLDAVD